MWFFLENFGADNIDAIKTNKDPVARAAKVGQSMGLDKIDHVDWPSLSGQQCLTFAYFFF